MKAISIKQPWAWAIIHAGKDIENRGWSTRYKGSLLIHASKGFDDEGYMFLWDYRKKYGIKEPISKSSFQMGGIIGSVHMVNCVTEHPSKWMFGPYGFVLINPKAIPFIQYKGALGLFDIPDSVFVK